MKRPPLPRVGALVLVSWDDAVHHGPRRVAVHDAPDECILDTVGWVTRRTRTSLFLAPERGPDFGEGRHRWVMRIPIGMIRGVTRIA